MRSNYPWLLLILLSAVAHAAAGDDLIGCHKAYTDESGKKITFSKEYRCCTKATIPDGVQYGGHWCQLEDMMAETDHGCTFHLIDSDTREKILIHGIRWACKPPAHGKRHGHSSVPIYAQAHCSSRSIASSMPNPSLGSASLSEVGNNISSLIEPEGQHANLLGMAPADEYFGQQKISLIEIQNRLHSLYDKVTDPSFANSGNAESVINGLSYVEGPFDEWRKKYPSDSDIPKCEIEIAQIYQLVPGAESQQKAQSLVSDVRKRYPGFMDEADNELASEQGRPAPLPPQNPPPQDDPNGDPGGD